MAADSRSPNGGLRFIGKRPGDPRARAGVTKAAGRGAAIRCPGRWRG